MKKVVGSLSIILFSYCAIAQQKAITSQTDWLVNQVTQRASVEEKGNTITLNNGLVRRTFAKAGNLACIDYTNLANNQQLLRSIKSEAKITINGKEYNVGGLKGQKENAYLITQWVGSLQAGKEDFVLTKYSVEDLKPFINWKNTTWALNKKQATGKIISFEYASPLTDLKGIVVKVNYELYDGIPLIVKWLSLENKSTTAFKLDRVVNEVLGLVEEESAVVGKPEEMKKQHGIYVETNYAFNNAMRYDISDQTTHWKIDKEYTSQVNYDYQTPCLLEVYPEKAPGIEVRPGETFKSVRTHELLMDSYDRQRRGLMIKKMYSTVAPWTHRIPFLCTLLVVTMSRYVQLLTNVRLLATKCDTKFWKSFKYGRQQFKKYCKMESPYRLCTQ